MIYAVSDLHGYPLDKILQKLDEIGFCQKDKLYVLGDCIDRGSQGIKIIRWIMSQSNVILIRGNHEAVLLKFSDMFLAEPPVSSADLVGERRNMYFAWTANGGHKTIAELQEYSYGQIKYIFEYISRAPLYKEVEAGGRKYILTHSGLGSFDPEKSLCEYSEDDLLWYRQRFSHRYYEDGRMVVFGHTPTVVYGEEYNGKPIFTDTWINIDAGCAIGNPPVILRLDDHEVFVVDKEE